VQMPDVLALYASLNLEPVSTTPEEFGQFIKADIQKYAEIVKRANIPLQ
jgi:tripartite-type tricarboxylate transporter receptor subunit TctC